MKIPKTTGTWYPLTTAAEYIILFFQYLGHLRDIAEFTPGLDKLRAQCWSDAL